MRLSLKQLLVAALVLAGGVAQGVPNGWSSDFEGARKKGVTQGKPVVVAVLDTKSSLPSRAWVRDVAGSSEWKEWLADHREGLLLVWCDRAEMSDSKWSKVAFLFSNSSTNATTSVPFFFAIDPDGRALRPDADEYNVYEADEFIAWLDEVVLEGWEDLPEGTLRWPSVRSGVGSAGVWSYNYDATSEAAFRARMPLLVAVVDSKNTAASSAWVRGVLMSDEWSDWAESFYLVMWDRAKISSSKWSKLAFLIAGNGASVVLPQIVVFDDIGRLKGRFKPTNQGDDKNYAKFDDFSGYVEDTLAGLVESPTAPGSIGLSASSVVVAGGVGNVVVSVARSGGTYGAKEVRLHTSQSAGGEPEGGEYFGQVVTNLVWRDGESGSKSVAVPLLGDMRSLWSVVPTNEFYMVLGQANTNGTVALGVTNQVVTLHGNVLTSGVWQFGVTNGVWYIDSATNIESVITWTAPADGTLKYKWGAPGAAVVDVVMMQGDVLGASLTNETGYLEFVEWIAGAGSGSGGESNDPPMPGGLMAYSVAPEAIVYAPGDYQAAVLDGGGRVRGALNMRLSAKGKVTAKAESGGRRWSLRGEWISREEDRATIGLSAGKQEVLRVELTATGIAGSMVGGESVVGDVVCTAEEAAQYGGYYTMVLGGDTGESSGEPGGWGYLTFTVAARRGSVKYSGRLADGTRVSGSTLLIRGESGEVLFAVYKGLYSKRGEVAGLVTLYPDGSLEFAHGVWLNGGPVRRGGWQEFECGLLGSGAGYMQAGSLEWLTGSRLWVDEQAVTSLEVSGKRVAIAREFGSIRIAPRTGIFSGKWRVEGQRPVGYYGVVVPSLGFGAGYTIIKDSEGAKVSLPVVLE